MSMREEKGKIVVEIAHSAKVKYCGPFEKLGIGIEGLKEIIGTQKVTGQELSSTIECLNRLLSLSDLLNLEFEDSN